MDQTGFIERLGTGIEVFRTAVQDARPPHAEDLIDGACRLKTRLAVIAKSSTSFGADEAADLLASACTQAGNLRLKPHADAGAIAFTAVLWHHMGTHGLTLTIVNRQFMYLRVNVDGSHFIGREKWALVCEILAIERALGWLAARELQAAA